MSTTARVQIRGMAELRRKLGDDLIAQPARNFLNRVGFTVQGAARKRAPVDRGLLKGSISTELDKAHLPMWVRIGPNISVGGGGGTSNYAQSQEEGTRPYWPPLAPLMEWGARQKPPLTPRQVQSVRYIISVRGIKPKRYMRDGLEASLPKIITLVPVMAAEIEKKAGAS